MSAMSAMEMSPLSMTPGKRLRRKTTSKANLVEEPSPEKVVNEVQTPVVDDVVIKQEPADECSTPLARKGRSGQRRSGGATPNGKSPKPSPKSTKSRAGKALKCKDEDALGNVDKITRRITQQCDNISTAAKIFSALRRCVGQPTNLGVFTNAEVEEAWCRCMGFYNEDQVAMSEGSSGGDDSSSGGETCSPGKQAKALKARTSRRQRDALLLESFMQEQEEDLSGEEDVDEETEEMEDGYCVEWPPKEAMVEIDDGYPVDAWTEESPSLLPGCDGFNGRCTAVMQKVGVAVTLHTELLDTVACPPLQPHQESVAFLLHPKSPVTRLLVDHPTGAGKTWEMIRVLDNYFHDPRPKVPIFPKSPVCRNFYAELLRWPSRYRDYFCCVRPADAAVASGCVDWKEKRMANWNLSHFLEEELKLLCYTIREVLEMKSQFHMGRMRTGLRQEFLDANPGEAMPAAPMRAISYTSAGGSFANLREQGDLPKSAMMKIGYTRGCDNVYTNKVVVMDEAHNLVRTQTQYGEQLQCLRGFLVNAKNLVLAGFTGTPILNKAEEGRQLLDIIKGISFKDSGDEGFLSSFPVRPQKLFPVSLPRGIPDAILTPQLQRQVVVNIELQGEALRKYDSKRRAGITNRLLCAYCNMSTFFGNFHDGKHGSRERILRDPREYCPKLDAIANEVAATPEKSLIMVSRQSGFNVMLELMRQVGEASNPPFAVATMDELCEFNHVSNIRGEKFRVLVADAFLCSEGVSFFAVRRTFMVDVPRCPSQMVQQVGRSIRMFGHQGLPEEEQVVSNRIYVATLPKWLQSPLACWVYRMFRTVKDGESETYAKKMLARLGQAGILTLEQMKEQIDAFGAKKRHTLRRTQAPGEKESLSINEIIVFLELAGLWDETQPQPAAKVHKSAPTTKPKLHHHFAGQSARFAALAAGSARLAALTSRMVGAPPPRAPPGTVGSKKKSGSSSSNHLVMSVRAAGRNLPDANAAFKALGEAVIVVDGVCEQINKLQWGADQTEWKCALEAGLSGIREDECIVGAIRAAASPTFNGKAGDLKELSAREVKQLLHQLQRAEKVMSLSSAFLAVKGLCADIEAIEASSEDHADAWSSKVAEELGALMKREQMLTALREVAPDAYVARETGGLETLTLVQVRALLDHLERQKSSDKMAAPWSPLSLVRAVRDLYLADTLADAIKTLEGETADEQALRHLEEQTAEFVPALAALRMKAIDSEIFKCFGEPPVCDDSGAFPEAAMEAADVVDAEGEREVEPVSLPEGWKLEWVSQIRGKAREQYRFVDPVGRKYYSVLELRTAVSGGIEAVEELRKAKQQARQLEAGQRPVVVRSKPTAARKKARW